MRDVIEMAREAGAHPSHNPELYDIWSISDKALERFAALVRADEREAYAHLAEKLTWADNKGVASAIRAQQALHKMAENARELGLGYEPQKRPQNCGTGYCSCIECVMEPTVPDALTAADKEFPEYTQGWNDCRQLMLEMRKP